jgi:hypothetical protein
MGLGQVQTDKINRMIIITDCSCTQNTCSMCDLGLFQYDQKTNW